MGSNVASDSPLAEIPHDAAILISGPPMTGKYQLLLRLLGLYADRVVFISTKHAADRVLEDYLEVVGSADERAVGIVDCVNYPQSVEPAEETDRIKHAGSPENLTRIGVKFTELFDRLYEGPDAGPVGVGIHSLSQLLMHSNVKQVYQFMQVLVGQTRSAGCLTAAVLDAAADDEDLQKLQQHFDGIVTTRENEAGDREFRVRGVTPSASAWTVF